MRTFFFYLMFIYALAIEAQTTVEMPNYVPPSPNAQEFLKYGDFPVSNYTGVPDIDIPIYTIDLKDISVPISLSYNASGIRVDEEASRIGLGWLLNTGGIITHTIKGRYNDFYNWHYFVVEPNDKLKDLTGIYNFSKYTIGSYSTQLPFTPSGMNKYDFYCALTNESTICGNAIDLAPDIFNYKFLGYSGRFIFSHSGQILKEKEDNLIITPTITTTYTGEKKLESFLITTPDGIKYYFNQTEKADVSRTVLASALTYNSSYYLTSIHTTNGTIVNFVYKKGNMSVTGIYDRTYSGSPNGSLSINYALYEVVYLDKIIYPSGEIKFDYAFDRIDNRREGRLTYIRIYESGVEKFKWNLQHGYFTSNHNGTDSPTVQNLAHVMPSYLNYFDDSWNKNRLKLKSLENVNNEQNYSYEFIYDESLLPNKLSTSIDHWGYFNNASNGNFLIPSYYQDISQDPSVINPKQHGYGANREASEIYNQAFILKEITYPTGGKTEFTFETNKYKTNDFENDPHRRDFMYSKQSISLIATQDQGANNIPWIVKSFTIPSGNQQINFSISAKFTLDKDLYRLYNGNPELELSIRKSLDDPTFIWNYTFNSLYLPYSITTNQMIEKSWSGISLLPGTYVLIARGTLFKQVKNINVEGSRVIYPDEYLYNNPYALGGGLRIKNILSYNNNGEFVSGKEYRYAENENEKYTTGRLMFYPRYQYTWGLRYRTSGLRGNGFSVGYSKVYIIEMDKDKVEINRSSYEYINKPDKNLFYTWEDQANPNPGSRVKVKDENPPGVEPFKFSENGTLLKETTYKSSTIPAIAREIKYEYGGLGDGPNIVWGVIKSDKIDASGVCFQDCDFDALYQATTIKPTDWAFGYLYPAIRPMKLFLRQKKETEYENGYSTSTITNYEYNSKGLTSKMLTTSGSNVLRSVEYKYPTDYTSNPIMKTLVELNRINTPVETKETVNGKLKHIVNDFAVFYNNIPQISSLKSNTGANKEMENRIVFHKYDNYGNPLYMTKDGVVNFVYLWGYNGQYVVAEIKNATYDQVKNALGVTPESISSSDTPNIILINGLRSKLDKAHITTYTHFQQVGVSSVKDPSGKAIYYTYDVLGRLKEIYVLEGGVKRILKAYIYGYNKL